MRAAILALGVSSVVGAGPDAGAAHPFADLFVARCVEPMMEGEPPDGAGLTAVAELDLQFISANGDDVWSLENVYFLTSDSVLLDGRRVRACRITRRGAEAVEQMPPFDIDALHGAMRAWMDTEIAARATETGYRLLQAHRDVRQRSHGGFSPRGAPGAVATCPSGECRSGIRSGSG